MFSTQKEPPLTKDQDDTAKEAKRAFQDAVKGKRASANNNIVDLAHKAGESLHDFLDSATHQAEHATHYMKDHITHKPIQSSIIAFAIGFLLRGLFRK